MRLLPLTLLAACSGLVKPGESGARTQETGDTQIEDEELDIELDRDDDGALTALDCDDHDPSVHPGASETCDGRDEDCDGAIDEDATDAPTWYLDVDGDGFASPARAVSACDPPDGAFSVAQDCDDDDDDVYPGAREICDDEVVNDCDGDEAAARTACTREGELTVRELAYPFIGLQTGERVGGALSMAGDMDGDGLADLLMGGTGAVGPDGASGGAFLLRGPLSTNHVEYEVDATIYGNTEGERAGAAVALGPDLDSDGYGELLVGAPGVATWGEDSGGVAFFYGPVGGPHPLAHGDAVIVSAAAGSLLGAALSLGGDLDGDGLGDLVATASGADASAGAVLVFLGEPDAVLLAADADATLTGSAAGDRAGAALSARADLDGDGVSDLVVGAPGRSVDDAARGEVWLALGPADDGLSAADADARLLGWEPAGDAGSSLDVGDEDGDGLADLLIGAPGWSDDGGDEGAAWLVLAPASRGVLDLAGADAFAQGDAGDRLGSGLALAGDHDGDGLADPILGLPRAASGDDPGVAALWYAPVLGALTPADAPLRVIGVVDGDQLGAAMASDGDTDGDGLADLLLGAPLDVGAVEPGGSAWQVISLGY